MEARAIQFRFCHNCKTRAALMALSIWLISFSWHWCQMVLQLRTSLLVCVSILPHGPPLHSSFFCSFFYKSPTCELLPVDNRNHVPLIYKVQPGPTASPQP